MIVFNFLKLFIFAFIIVCSTLNSHLWMIVTQAAMGGFLIGLHVAGWIEGH